MVAISDMPLIIGALVVVVVYLGIHMRSAALAVAAFIHIILLFPLAYFFYR